MSLVDLDVGFYWPPVIPYTAGSGTSVTINATGQKMAVLGNIRTPNRGAKSIRKVHWLWGTVTKAGGSALTFSLQDVDLANGPVARPDGTQDQTYAIANADAGFVSSTWYTTGNLTADRSVTHGDLVAAVWEFDGGGRLGADTISITHHSAAVFNATPILPSVATYNGATWAASTGSPNVLFEFSDGTFGLLDGAYVRSSLSTVAYKQDTAGSDEYGIVWTPEFNCTVDGAWLLYVAAASTSNCDLILYAGTTALVTVSLDGNVSIDATMRCNYVPFAPQTLTAGTAYYLALKPTQTTSNVSIQYVAVNAAGHFACWPGGTGIVQAKRIDLGAWDTSVTTRRVMMGLHVSAIDAGGSGGMIGGGNLNGGFL